MDSVPGFAMYEADVSCQLFSLPMVMAVTFLTTHYITDVDMEAAGKALMEKICSHDHLQFKPQK